MGREYKDCEIVFDLLPLYLDGKTGEDSNAYMQEHLAHCESCRQTFLLMQEDFDGLPVQEKRSKQKKKRRKRNRVKLLLLSVLGIYILGLLAIICWFWLVAVQPVL